MQKNLLVLERNRGANAPAPSWIPRAVLGRLLRVSIQRFSAKRPEDKSGEEIVPGTA